MEDIELIIEKAMLSRPEHATVAAETKEALASYYAGDQLYPYIYPFSRIENQEKLGWRRFQTVKHYRNFPKEAARQYVEGVFKTKQITRKYGNEDFDQYLSQDYQSWFNKFFAIHSLLLPEIYVVVSLPSSDIEPLTKEDEKELDIRPYPYVVFPHNVYNFCVDRNGDLEWICIKPPDREYFIIYTETEYLEVSASVNGETNVVTTLIEKQIPHGFSRVPVVRVAWTENASYATTETPVGHGFLKELIDLSIANLQYTSMLVEMGYFHLSYKIVMGEETAKRTIESGIGNQTAIVEEAEEKGTTRYLELPRMEIAELKDLVFEKMPAAAFHAARLRDRSGTVAQSGLAKAFDMVPETAALSSVADFWSTYDQKIVSLLAEGFVGSENLTKQEAEIQYPMNFDVRSPQETLKDFADFASSIVASKLPVSEIAVREMVKRMQRIFLSDLDEETLNEIDTQTDEAPFEVTGQTTPFKVGSDAKPNDTASFIPNDIEQSRKIGDI